LRPVLNAACEFSVRIKETVVSSAGSNSLSSPLAKLSKYSDQIVLSLLRAAPADIMDEPFSKDALEFLINKLQVLVSAHSGGCSKETAALLEKSTPLPIQTSKASSSTWDCCSYRNRCYWPGCYRSYSPSCYT
jgi:hypothetical protein